MQNVEMKSEICAIEEELVELRQETKSLSHLYNMKCSEVEEMSEKHVYELTQRDKKIDELQLVKHQR
jgi:hypothetical protein